MYKKLADKQTPTINNTDETLFTLIVTGINQTYTCYGHGYGLDAISKLLEHLKKTALANGKYKAYIRPGKLYKPADKDCIMLASFEVVIKKHHWFPGLTAQEDKKENNKREKDTYWYE